MRRTKILNASEVKRMSYVEAQSSYFKHCRLKNLRPQTITYYKEDTDYFQAKTGVKYADEVTQELFDEFIFSETEAGKKIDSLNSRIQGLRVFFKFCTEREYMKPIAPKLMKAIHQHGSKMRLAEELGGQQGYPRSSTSASF